MQSRTITLLLAILVMLVGACQSEESDDRAPADPPAPHTGIASTTEIAAMSPVELTQSFYTWHLTFPGDPLAHPRAKWDEYLTEALVQVIRAETEAGGDDHGAVQWDPFVCSYARPETVTVQAIATTDTAAQVVVRFTDLFGGQPQAMPVDLAQENGQWQIDRIDCTGLRVDLPAVSPVPATPITDVPDVIASADEIAAMAPVELVESFYRWHVSFPGSPLSHPRDKWQDYLTTEWIAKVQAIIASFDVGGYDLFLCAQDKPVAFAAEETTRTDDAVTLSVRIGWNPGELTHSVTVDVIRQDGPWKINRVTCPAN
jgi:hypothetical protein